MANINVKINSRTYQVVCNDGEEEHLLELADFVEKRVQQLISSVGQVGEARLLVMMGLLLSDELADAYKSNQKAHPNGSVVDKRIDEKKQVAINIALAERIDRIAVKLEPA